MVPPAPPDLDQLVAVALASRPELADLKSQLEGAHAVTGLAREYWLPDFTIGVTRDYAYRAPARCSLECRCRFRCSSGSTPAARSARRATGSSSSTASYRDLEGQVGQDLRASHAAAAAALRQAVYIRDQLLPLARQAYRIASVSYGLGGSSALELLDARRNLLDAESQYTDALAAANNTRAELERAAAAPLDSFETGGTHDR